jgi:hypothetical protein
MLVMVPPVFEKDPTLSEAAKRGLEALYLQGEPWDGPAALIFTDGTLWARSSIATGCVRCATRARAMGWLWSARRRAWWIWTNRASPNASGWARAKWCW